MALPEFRPHTRGVDGQVPLASAQKADTVVFREAPHPEVFKLPTQSPRRFQAERAKSAADEPRVTRIEQDEPSDAGIKDVIKSFVERAAQYPQLTSAQRTLLFRHRDRYGLEKVAADKEILDGINPDKRDGFIDLIRRSRSLPQLIKTAEPFLTTDKQARAAQTERLKNHGTSAPIDLLYRDEEFIASLPNDPNIMDKFALALRDSKSIQDLLGNCNLLLIASVARRSIYDKISLEDRMQAGYFGLVTAIEQYDVTKINPKTGRHYAFSTYATGKINRAIQKAAYEEGRVIRLPSDVEVEVGFINKLDADMEITHNRRATDAELREGLAERNKSITPEKIADIIYTVRNKNHNPAYLDTPINMRNANPYQGGLTIGDFVEDPHVHVEDTAITQADQDRLAKTVQRVLADLPEKQRQIVWLLATQESLTLGDIGERVGLSRQRTATLRDSVYESLRNNEALAALAAAHFETDNATQDEGKVIDQEEVARKHEAIERGVNPKTWGFYETARTNGTFGILDADTQLLIQQYLETGKTFKQVAQELGLATTTAQRRIVSGLRTVWKVSPREIRQRYPEEEVVSGKKLSSAARELIAERVKRNWAERNLQQQETPPAA